MLKLRTAEQKAIRPLTVPAVATEAISQESIERRRDYHNDTTAQTAVGQGQIQKGYRFRFALTRSRKRALVMLFIASLVGWRWSVANTNPEIALPAPSKPHLTSPNAAHFYAAATELYDYQKLSSFDPENTSVSEKKKIVTEASESLRLLREGLKYRYQGGVTNWYSTVQEDHGLSAPVPNFVNLRSIMRTLVAEAQVAKAEGRHADAINACLDEIKFAQDIGHGNALIDGMIGVLGQSMGTLEGIKNVQGLKAQEARDAAHRLAGLMAEEQTFPEIMEQERLMIYSTMDKMVKEDGVSGASLFTTQDIGQSLAFRVGYDAVIFWYGKDGIYQSYKQYMDEVVRQTGLPYQQAKALPEVRPSNPLVESFAPRYKRALTGTTRAIARKRLLLAQLAIQAYCGEHNGMAPRSLEELTQGPNPYLTSVPIDLFSSDAKEPLRYKDGVAYSVGENGVDDGNTHDDAELSKW